MGCFPGKCWYLKAIGVLTYRSRLSLRPMPAKLPQQCSARFLPPMYPSAGAVVSFFQPVFSEPLPVLMAI